MRSVPLTDRIMPLCVILGAVGGAAWVWTGYGPVVAVVLGLPLGAAAGGFLGLLVLSAVSGVYVLRAMAFPGSDTGPNDVHESGG